MNKAAVSIRKVLAVASALILAAPLVLPATVSAQDKRPRAQERSRTRTAPPPPRYTPPPPPRYTPPPPPPSRSRAGSSTSSSRGSSRGSATSRGSSRGSDTRATERSRHRSDSSTTTRPSERRDSRSDARSGSSTNRGERSGSSYGSSTTQRNPQPESSTTNRNDRRDARSDARSDHRSDARSDSRTDGRSRSARPWDESAQGRVDAWRDRNQRRDDTPAAGSGSGSSGSHHHGGSGNYGNYGGYGNGGYGNSGNRHYGHDHYNSYDYCPTHRSYHRYNFFRSGRYYYNAGWSFRLGFGTPFLYYGYYGYPMTYGYGYDHYRYRPYRVTYDRDRQGAVDLNIKPKSTEVYVNGNYVGKVNEYDGFPRYLWLDEGSYELTFYHPDYQNWTRRVHVDDRRVISLDHRMVPGAGVAPETWSAPPTYASAPSAQAAPQEAAPAPTVDVEPGRLLLRITPGDASVYLDGHFLGLGHELMQLASGMLVNPGEHLLEIVHPRYPKRAAKVRISSQQSTTVEIDLAEGDAPQGDSSD